MQKIVTDVTYIKHNGKWYYLAGYKVSSTHPQVIATYLKNTM